MASPQINAVNMSFRVLIRLSGYDFCTEDHQRVEGHRAVVEQQLPLSGC